MTKLFLVGSLIAGCSGQIDVPDPGSGDPGSVGETVDAGAPGAPGAPPLTDFDRATMQVAAAYKSLPQVNIAPYKSSLGAFDINVYVHGDAKTYRAIHPDVSSTASIAVGTVIVREVFDGQGQIAKLTIMAKAPSGYDPTLGDWWFGEATPDGTPVKLGRLTECHGCHEPRAPEDFVFGVPKLLEGH